MKKSFITTVLIFISALFIMASVIGARGENGDTADDVIEPRVNALLAKMTLREKIGQMLQLPLYFVRKPGSEAPGAAPEIDEAKLVEIMQNYQPGSFLGGRAYTAAQWVSLLERLQVIAMKHQLHNIPILYGIDHVHGANYLWEGAVFPHNINMAATFEPRLAREEGQIIAEETAALGHSWNFAPILDVAENKYWPRFYETFGEDPLLVSVMGRSFIRGFMEQTGKQEYKAAVCAKHFLGYSDPRTGFDRSPAYIPPQRLREIFVPPFRAAVDAGVETFMINSGEIDGVPVHANPALLTDLLRRDLGFKGVVISDWDDVMRLHTAHKVAADPKEAVFLAVNAGIDITMAVQFDFCPLLEELVKEGRISMQRIDQSVRRILSLKMRLGLFERPFPSPAAPEMIRQTREAHRLVNREAARESIVLIKNDNHILPLSEGIKKIVVGGPNADIRSGVMGGWSYDWMPAEEHWFPPEMPTFLGALKSRFPHTNIVHAPDSAAIRTEAPDCGAIVLFLGEAPYSEGFGSITDLNLPADQLQLIHSATETGKPVIAVLSEGRPRTFGEGFDHCSAVLFAGWPGLEGAPAIADILAGDVNPSGKMPFSYPFSQGHILSYHHKQHAFSPMHVLTDQRTRWTIAPFGHGLSYTSFQYSRLELARPRIKKGETLRVSVTVANTGARTGKEAVLWFISDHHARITRPVKLLKHFEKRELKPGESAVFSFDIDPGQHLSYPDATGKQILEPGAFTISVAGLESVFYLD